MTKFYLISNMYPSAKSPFYGIFVRKLEVELSILGVEFPARSLIKGLQRNRIIKAFKYLFFIISVLINCLLNWRYSVVHMHYVPIAVIPLYFLKKFRKNLTMMVNFHGGYLIDHSGQPLPIPDKVYSIADFVIVPSSFMADFLKEHYNFNSSKILISPSGGVNILSFRTMPEIRKANNGIFTIGFLSRISQGKGWEIFVDALVLLKARGIKFHAIMIGGGTEHALLREKLEKLQLTKMVEVTGAMSHEQLPAQLNRLDVNVFPTELYESLGLVGIEAMACGIPVIGSNIGGLPSYIDDGSNGYLFRTGDSEDLHEKLVRFNDLEPDTKQQMSESARETAEQYDSHRIAKNLYKQILE